MSRLTWCLAVFQLAIVVSITLSEKYIFFLLPLLTALLCINYKKICFRKPNLIFGMAFLIQDN